MRLRKAYPENPCTLVLGSVNCIICSLLVLILAALPACSTTERWADAAYLTELDSDNITLGGAPLLIPAYGEMYIVTTTNITYLTVATVFYKAALNTINGEQKGFTSDTTGRMTYNDITPDRICLVTNAMSLKSDTADVVISARLYINGLPSASSLIKLNLLAINAPGVMTLTALAILQPGDYMEIWLASNTLGVKIQTNGFNFVATTVD